MLSVHRWRTLREPWDRLVLSLRAFRIWRWEPGTITHWLLFPQLLIVNLMLFSRLPEHAERRRTLQRDLQFSEPQRNRRRLQRMRLSASDLILLWMKLCANPLHLHTHVSTKKQECSHIFLIFSVTFKEEPKVLASCLSSWFLNVEAFGPEATFTPELSLHYSRLMSEGTCRITPLFACQLVSGDIITVFYSGTFLF